MLVFMEHNPYNPATQYIVKSCDIYADAVLLRPGQLRRMFADWHALPTSKQKITRSRCRPPIRFSSRLDSFLGHLPFGAQYYLSGVKPSS